MYFNLTDVEDSFEGDWFSPNNDQEHDFGTYEVEDEDEIWTSTLKYFCEIESHYINFRDTKSPC